MGRTSTTLIGLAMMAAACGQGGSATTTTAAAAATTTTSAATTTTAANAEAVALAEAYLAALNSYDAMAAWALLAPDAFVRDALWEGLDELEMGLEANRVYEYRFEPFECGPNPLRSDPENVLCAYTLQSIHHRITGERLLRSSFDIRVADGLIVWAHNTFNRGDMGPAYGPFGDWLDERDRRAEARIYYSRNPGVEIVTPILTEEALAETAALLAEYEQWASEQ